MDGLLLETTTAGTGVTRIGGAAAAVAAGSVVCGDSSLPCVVWSGDVKVWCRVVWAVLRSLFVGGVLVCGCGGRLCKVWCASLRRRLFLLTAR